MHPLWQELSVPQGSEKTHTHSYWGKAISLPLLHPQGSTQGKLESAYYNCSWKVCYGALSMEGTSSVHLHLGMSPRRLLATTQRHPSTRRQPNPRQLLAQPRKHPCPQCTRIFSSIRDLDRHFLTHTGEKPYECPHCPHRANRKGNLKTHIRALHPDSVM